MNSVGGNIKTRRYYYKPGGKYLQLNVRQVGSYCYMENAYAKVYHMNFGTRTPSSTYRVRCTGVSSC